MLKQEIDLLAKKESYTFDDLLAITRILRSEEGCPWDREQDHHSIRASMIEETYEVVEAIDNDDTTLLREELGDALFQVVFHAQIEQEKASFGMGEVVDDICKKMIHRHPHVFGEVRADTSDAVLKNWEAIKTEEKQRITLSDKLRAIPPMLPALMRASKVSKKADRTENRTEQSLIDSLIARLTSLGSSSKETAQEEIGMLLFEMVDLSRVLGVDAELALSAKIDAFIDEIANK